MRPRTMSYESYLLNSRKSAVTVTIPLIKEILNFLENNPCLTE